MTPEKLSNILRRDAVGPFTLSSIIPGRKSAWSPGSIGCLSSVRPILASSRLDGGRAVLASDHKAGRRNGHSHERSDPLRQLRSDVACWSATRAIAIRIRRA
jgi:hypothetical protein